MSMDSNAIMYKCYRSKPRDNALHCCLLQGNYKYAASAAATNKMFLNPAPRPQAFVHTLKTSGRCAPVTRFREAESWRFARLGLLVD